MYLFLYNKLVTVLHKKLDVFLELTFKLWPWSLQIRVNHHLKQVSGISGLDDVNLVCLGPWPGRTLTKQQLAHIPNLPEDVTSAVKQALQKTKLGKGWKCCGRGRQSTLSSCLLRQRHSERSVVTARLALCWAPLPGLLPRAVVLRLASSRPADGG